MSSTTIIRTEPPPRDSGLKFRCCGDSSATHQKVASRLLEKLDYRVDVVADGLARAAGMDAYLSKPIDRAKLDACLEHLLPCTSSTGLPLEI